MQFTQGRSKRVDMLDKVQGPRDSRGPPTKMNPKNIGLGTPHCYLSMGPQGLAMPVNVLTYSIVLQFRCTIINILKKIIF